MKKKKHQKDLTAQNCFVPFTVTALLKKTKGGKEKTEIVYRSYIQSHNMMNGEQGNTVSKAGCIVNNVH